MGKFLVRFVLPLLVAVIVALGAGLLAYAVSMQKGPVVLDARTAAPWVPEGVAMAARTNVLTLCIVCAGYAAAVVLLLMLAIGSASRRSRGRKFERQVSLLKSKLLERDEEIERLQSRLRGEDVEGAGYWSERPTPIGGAPSDAPAPEPSGS